MDPQREIRMLLPKGRKKRSKAGKIKIHHTDTSADRLSTGYDVPSWFTHSLEQFNQERRQIGK